jgi:hypothetical protein
MTYPLRHPLTCILEMHGKARSINPYEKGKFDQAQFNCMFWGFVLTFLSPEVTFANRCPRKTRNEPSWCYVLPTGVGCSSRCQHIEDGKHRKFTPLAHRVSTKKAANLPCQKAESVPETGTLRRFLTSPPRARAEWRKKRKNKTVRSIAAWSATGVVRNGNVPVWRVQRRLLNK